MAFRDGVSHSGRIGEARHGASSNRVNFASDRANCVHRRSDVVQSLAGALAAWTAEPDAKRLRLTLIQLLLLLQSR
jgi:hypothetical protein